MCIYLCVKGAMTVEHMHTMESATSNSNGADQTSQKSMMVCALLSVYGLQLQHTCPEFMLGLVLRGKILLKRRWVITLIKERDISLC